MPQPAYSWRDLLVLLHSWHEIAACLGGRHGTETVLGAVQGGAWLSPKLLTSQQPPLDRQTSAADGVAQGQGAGPIIITGAHSTHNLAQLRHASAACPLSITHAAGSADSDGPGALCKACREMGTYCAGGLGSVGSLLALCVAQQSPAAPLLLLGRTGRPGAGSGLTPGSFGAAAVTLARCDVSSADEAHVLLRAAAAMRGCQPLRVMLDRGVCMVCVACYPQGWGAVLLRCSALGSVLHADWVWRPKQLPRTMPC